MNLKNAKNKLEQYFDTYNLKILDIDIRNEGDKYGDHYSAVTFDYVYRYVLKKRINKANTAFLLMKLLIDGNLYTLYCNVPNNIVFCNVRRYSFHHKVNKYGKFDSGWKIEQYQQQKLINFLETSYINKLQNEAEMTSS